MAKQQSLLCERSIVFLKRLSKQFFFAYGMSVFFADTGEQLANIF
jgi:hypothetical protein